MAYLTPSQRRALERTIQQARSAAEAGAADALRRLGVHEARRPDHLTEGQGQLRNRLRAHARTLGDALSPDGTQAIGRLTEAAAYVQWHRLLFARFLLERRLLRHPEDGGDLTLLDCREEAGSIGLADEWAAAAHYTARLLVGVFPPDDPVGAISLAPEHARALRQHLLSLDAAMHAAEDTLGWTYQFWRSQERADINASGRKIGAAELPAVTQLFTEPYMVRFLLHNTLGAWWAGKVLEQRPELAKAAADEETLRRTCSPPGYVFDMLRFIKEGERWWPAAGVFPGWPRGAKDITVLDPCCGSGHFLTEALAILVALRRAEEGISAADATAAVLQDNLFGLEIDGRCVQIAAFAVALAAWRLGGWQPLPLPHIAWSGAPPPLPKPQFVPLADGNSDLARALSAIHDLFQQAPLLGSLIEPVGGDLVDPVRVARVEAMLKPVIERARAAEPERAEGAIAARGMADAVAILARRYTLQATNPPFLGRAEQLLALLSHVKRRFPSAAPDLSTAMLSRFLALAEVAGSVATVTKQEWCFIKSYRRFREDILDQFELNFFTPLGEEAWETFGMRGPLATLTSWSRRTPDRKSVHFCLDTTHLPVRSEKAAALCNLIPEVISQHEQRSNPDSRLTTRLLNKEQTLLQAYAISQQGITTGDSKRFARKFWELMSLAKCRLLQSTPSQTMYFGGREGVLQWDSQTGSLDDFEGATLRGREVWGRPGVLIGLMRSLPACLSTGELSDDNTSRIIPLNSNDTGVILGILFIGRICQSRQKYR
jgi:hypothetical protein